jgi:prepilin-type N-terminal cleavage/methylation domain-containing protein
MKHKVLQANAGYTLIELTLVILIIGILIAGVAIPLASQVGLAKQKQAQEELARIEEALIGYAIAHPANRLPCPDWTGDGQGDDDGSLPHPCDNSNYVEGDLPWADLGVGRFDPWGNPYRYRGNIAYTATTGVPDPPDTNDGLAVKDLGGSDLTVGDPNGPAAIVFSTGPNGTADADNVPASPYDDDYTQDLTDESFDDILVIVSRHVLVNRLVQSQTWP